MNRYIKPTIAAIVIATAGTGAYAATSHGQNDALAISGAKTSLVQAIATAEQSASGKAVEAKFKGDAKEGPLYKVEVVSGDKVFDVKVDAKKGTVISSKVDTPDHDEDDD